MSTSLCRQPLSHILASTQASGLGAYRTYLKWLKAFFSWVSDRHDIPDPIKPIKAPPAPKKTQPVLTRRERELLIRAPLSPHWPEDERRRDYAFSYLMHVTGARVGSILKLRQSDFGDGYVWAENAKGEKQQIPVRSEAIALVRDLGGDYVFRNRFGRPLGYHGARLILKRALALAGLDRPRLATHLFRRGFASDCLDDGMDLETLRQLMGHASILQTQEYLYLATDSVKAKYLKYAPGKGAKDELTLTPG